MRINVKSLSPLVRQLALTLLGGAALLAGLLDCLLRDYQYNDLPKACKISCKIVPCDMQPVKAINVSCLKRVAVDQSCFTVFLEADFSTSRSRTLLSNNDQQLIQRQIFKIVFVKFASETERTLC